MKTFIIIILTLISKLTYSQNIDSLNITPNPFETATSIYFGLANNDTVTINIYNNVGDTVKTFMQDSLINAGYYSIPYSADSLANGTYIVSLKLGTHKTINKLIVKNNATTVIENLSRNDHWKIYPNPTSNLLTISISGIKNILITDLNGKTCKTIKTRENNISLADLKSGSYIIRVFSTDNKLLSVERIIKETE
jgi:hypothetical protein